MSKIPFDAEGGLELAREIMLERLRREPGWNQINMYETRGFEDFVDFVDKQRSKDRLFTLLMDVFWEFIIQGVIAPGLNPANPNLPWFHLTDYGKEVVATNDFPPHDPTGYLNGFRKSIGNPDPTVEGYLTESLNCFTRGCVVASVVMLGVASERAFLMLCDSLLQALSSSGEQAAFSKLLKSNPIKPKQDWVLKKIQSIQGTKPQPFPDNVNVMLTVIFDFIRVQRNNLGHPQKAPPKVQREEAFVNLRLFPTYYRMLTLQDANGNHDLLCK